jgi:hypothetical protein
VKRMSGRSNLIIWSKEPYLLIRPFDRAQTLTEAVFLRVAMEWLLGNNDVWSVVLEYRLKRAIPFDPTVGSSSNFYTGCFP